MTPSPNTLSSRLVQVRAAGVVGIALAAQALVVGLAWSNTMATQFTNFVHEDAPMYYAAADMYERRGLLYDGDDYHREVRVRVPLYPLLLLVLGKLAGALGVWPAAFITAVHAFVAAAECLLVYRIVACLISDRVGFLAGLIAAVAPANPIYSLTHMPEGPANALWLTAILLTLWAPGGGWGWVIAAGLSGAAAALTKPVYLYAEGLTVLALILAIPRPPKRRLALLITCHVLSFSAGVAPWYVRNYVVWQEPVFTPQGGNQFYLYLRPKLFNSLGRPVNDPTHELTDGFADDRVPRTREAWEARFGSSWDNLGKRLGVYNGLAIEDFKQERRGFVWLWVKEHPKLYLWTGVHQQSIIAGLPQKDERYADGPGGTVRWMRDIGWLPYQLVTWALLGAIYVLAVVGLVITARRHGRLALWILLSLCYFAGIPFFSVGTRYRYPLMVLFAIVAAVTVDRLISLRRATATALPEALATQR